MEPSSRWKYTLNAMMYVARRWGCEAVFDVMVMRRDQHEHDDICGGGEAEAVSDAIAKEGATAMGMRGGDGREDDDAPR